LGLRLCAALVAFWHVRGPIAEARSWARALIDRAGEESLELQARVLPWVGDWALVQGDYVDARAWGERSLRLARQLQDPMAIGRALHDLGEVAAAVGEYELARERYEQAIAAAGEVGYPAPGSVANLGALALAEHEYDRAGDFFDRALTLFREQGKPGPEAMVLSSLAAVERRRGRYSAALALLEESVALSRELAYEEVLLYCTLELAALLAARDELEEAVRLLGAAESGFERLAIALTPPDEETRADTLATVRAALAEDVYSGALASGRLLSTDDAVDLGFSRLNAGV
jgi:tetratricopeptide (TPR) repeat protein